MRSEIILAIAKKDLLSQAKTHPGCHGHRAVDVCYRLPLIILLARQPRLHEPGDPLDPI